jgi:hypothetical protein
MRYNLDLNVPANFVETSWGGKRKSGRRRFSGSPCKNVAAPQEPLFSSQEHHVEAADEACKQGILGLASWSGTFTAKFMKVRMALTTTRVLPAMVEPLCSCVVCCSRLEDSAPQSWITENVFRLLVINGSYTVEAEP